MTVVQFAPARVPANEHIAVHFLKALDPAAAAFNLRPFAEAPGAAANPRKHNAVPLADVPALIAQCDKEKRGLFVVVNEGGDTDASITRTRAVFCDFDGKAHLPEGVTWEIADDDQIEAAMEACLDRALMAQRGATATDAIPADWPRGSTILRSGHGFHVYWFVDDVPPAEFRPMQRALAARFGSDPAVSNPSRVMRLPGSRNWKGGDGVLVEPRNRCTLWHEGSRQPETGRGPGFIGASCIQRLFG